jgi:hypothetical protein
VNPTKEATMSKKEKAVLALAEDFQALIALVPKLTTFIKVYKEIGTGYQKYRKNGGVAISGIEKHLGIKEEKIAPVLKKKEAVAPDKTKTPKESDAIKKDKKKIKK